MCSKFEFSLVHSVYETISEISISQQISYPYPRTHTKEGIQVTYELIWPTQYYVLQVIITKIKDNRQYMEK